MSSIYRIGDLTFDAGRQLLRRGADPIHLGPLTYRLLEALIAASPNVVDYDELAEAVWDGRPISPETISQRVKLLRDAVGDEAGDPRYIELVRGRGYRLIPTVIAGSTADVRKKRVVRATMAGVVLALAAGMLIWLSTGPLTTPERRHSVAVLPFADLSPRRDQGYFADGLAEDILNALSRTTPLRVIARTSSFAFRDRNDDIASIARRLDVTHVVEGSVRKSGDRLRVTVQLVSAAGGTHVWSETFDRALDDVLRLQDEIAGSVAAALEVKLVGQTTAAHSPPARVNPEAYDLYLRGRQRLRDFALADAERYFDRSLAIDPGFIPAYRSQGEAYVRRIVDVQVPLTEYREKLRGLVDRGLERAPDDAGLIGLSGQLARYDGDIALAEERFSRALELEPMNFLVQMVYGMLKGDQGYPLQASAIAQRGREIDPLNPLFFLGDWSVATDLWKPQSALVAADRYEAVAAPTDLAAFGLRAITKMVWLGDIGGAIRELEQRAAALSPGSTQAFADPCVYYNLGDVESGDAAQEFYQRLYPYNPGADFSRVCRHLVFGEIAEAQHLVLPSFTERDDYSATYADPFFARLAVDALIDRGDASSAVKIIDGLAPKYASYRTREQVDPREFSPAPYPVKSVYSSYPALYFPDYIRALRADGDVSGAKNMLSHLDAVLQWRRERGLFVEERHAAEARMLSGDINGALNALEKGERDRTIFHGWHMFLLHNPVFAVIRDHPRFRALIERVRAEMARQRAELAAARPFDLDNKGPGR